SMTNIALPFFYRKEYPQDYNVLRHVVMPAIGTVALIPALVAPLLPFLPQFSAAGPVAWQIIATVPLTALWAVIGIVLASRASGSTVENMTHPGEDQDSALQVAEATTAHAPA